MNKILSTNYSNIKIFNGKKNKLETDLKITVISYQNLIEYTNENNLSKQKGKGTIVWLHPTIIEEKQKQKNMFQNSCQRYNLTQQLSIIIHKNTVKICYSCMYSMDK